MVNLRSGFDAMKDLHAEQDALEAAFDEGFKCGGVAIIRSLRRTLESDTFTELDERGRLFMINLMKMTERNCPFKQ